MELRALIRSCEERAEKIGRRITNSPLPIETYRFEQGRLSELNDLLTALRQLDADDVEPEVQEERSTTISKPASRRRPRPWGGR